MDRQLTLLRALARPDPATLGARYEQLPGTTKHRAPLGPPMICRDPKHHEERGPDIKVISHSTSGGDVWFIRSGLLRLQRYCYDGRRQILSLYLPGDVIGYENDWREGVSVETVTQTGLCRIDRRKFDAVLRTNRTLRDDFYRQSQDQLDRLHWLTWSLGTLRPDERLSAFLALSSTFMPYQTLPDGTGVLSMLLPRKDLADLLATTVESISRITHKMAESGLIDIRDPAHFRLLDLQKLVRLGKVEVVYDRMARNIAKWHNQLMNLSLCTSDTPACFCGR